MTAATPFRLNGRRVLAMLLGFFLVISAVNGVFIWLALDSWSGLSTEDPYRRGLAYNETLDRAQRQRTLAWQLTYELAIVGDRARLTALVTGLDGLRLSDIQLSAILRRPTHAGEDITLRFENRNPGTFQSSFPKPQDGQWDLVILAERSNGEDYRLEDRVWVK